MAALTKCHSGADKMTGIYLPIVLEVKILKQNYCRCASTEGFMTDAPQGWQQFVACFRHLWGHSTSTSLAACSLPVSLSLPLPPSLKCVCGVVYVLLWNREVEYRSKNISQNNQFNLLNPGSNKMSLGRATG